VAQPEFASEHGVVIRRGFRDRLQHIPVLKNLPVFVEAKDIYSTWIIHKSSPRRRQVRKEQHDATNAIMKLSLNAAFSPNQATTEFFMLAIFASSRF